MIYICSLLLCIFLAWMYDVLGYTRNKWHWYYLLLVWFIGVSGLQYMVGTDIPVYMEEYYKNYDELRFDVGDIEGKRQPGWILLCYGCRQITNDFILLKMIQAAFVNIAIFSFFKRESRYVFCCIVLYALTSYLLINFNILRQGIALGFILYFISFYKEKKYVLSIIFLFLAYMFHNSALAAFIIPVFGLLKYNKKVLLGLCVVSFFLIYGFLKIDLEGLLDLFFGSEYLGEGMSEMGNIYAKSDRLGVQEGKVGIVRLFRVAAFLIVALYYIKRKRDVYMGGIALTYLIFLTLSFKLPIMFRIGTFFEIPFYVLLSSVIIEYPMRRLYQIRYLFYISTFVVYSLFPYKEYMMKYPGSNYRYIDQYYPYHSVLNPEVEESIDRQKILFFKWM